MKKLMIVFTILISVITAGTYLMFRIGENIVMLQDPLYGGCHREETG